MEHVIWNSIKCNVCGDVVVSRFGHDFAACSCGKCAADGGRQYRRRVFDGEIMYEERSIFYPSDSSEQIAWDVESEEEFRLFESTWDVREAKRIIKNAPRKILPVKAVEWEQLLQKSVGNKLRIGISIDWDRVKKEPKSIDLQIPLILGDRGKPETTVFVLDGWHRIARAAEEKIDFLPAVLLTAEETASILVETP